MVKIGEDDGMEALALPAVVPQAYDTELLDSRTALVLSFNLLGKDVLPTCGDDQLLESAGQK